MPDHPDISAAIITLDEARQLERCLASVQWMAAIVIVDSGSTDGTADIARRYTSRIHEHPFQDFAAQKNFAAEQAPTDWIFSIDADEVMTPELAAEIRQALQSGPRAERYAVPRTNIYFGHPVRHVLGRDEPVRMYRKSTGRFEGRVHEKVAGGRRARLDAPLLHYSCRSYREWVQRHRTYTRMDARQRFAAGRRFSPARLLLAPWRVFLFRYIRLQGFRDGPTGAAMAGEMALSTVLFEMELYRLGKTEAAPA